MFCALFTNLSVTMVTSGITLTEAYVLTQKAFCLLLFLSTMKEGWWSAAHVIRRWVCNEHSGPVSVTQHQQSTTEHIKKKSLLPHWDTCWDNAWKEFPLHEDNPAWQPFRTVLFELRADAGLSSCFCSDITQISSLIERHGHLKAVLRVCVKPQLWAGCFISARCLVLE